MCTNRRNSNRYSILSSLRESCNPPLAVSFRSTKYLSVTPKCTSLKQETLPFCVRSFLSFQEGEEGYFVETTKVHSSILTGTFIYNFSYLFTCNYWKILFREDSFILLTYPKPQQMCLHHWDREREGRLEVFPFLLSPISTTN